MEGRKNAKVCVYEYVRNSFGRIRVTEVIENCGITKINAIKILEELRSKGYLGGNPKIGYWFIRTREHPQFT
jgi:predicted transcriptional regulator